MDNKTKGTMKVNKAYVEINITNIEEAKEKAAELVESLKKARELIEQLNETDLIMFRNLANQDRE